MHLLSSRIVGGGAAALLASVAAVHAASGLVEVDFMFRQNDTYAPTHILPVVWTIRGADGLAAYLHPHLQYSIYPYGNFSDALHNSWGYYDETWTNFTSSDPYIEYGGALESLNTEGIWTLRWGLRTVYCSASGDPNATMKSNGGEVTFTTKNGAKKPDVAATTPRDTCQGDGFAFDITSTRDSKRDFENGKPCAVLADTTPTPSACGIKIEASAASSISADLTHRACTFNTAPATWCPPRDKNMAGSLMVPSVVVGGAVCLAAAVGAFGFLAMV